MRSYGESVQPYRKIAHSPTCSCYNFYLQLAEKKSSKIKIAVLAMWNSLRCDRIPREDGFSGRMGGRGAWLCVERAYNGFLQIRS